MGLKRMLAVGSLVAVVAAMGVMGPVSAALAEATPDTGFKLKAGAVYMTREGEHNHLLVRDLVTGAELLNSSDLELGWAPGVDVSAGYCGEMFMVEARYLGAIKWSDDTDTANTPNGLILNHRSPLLGFGPMNYDADYESWLHSAELNFGWKPMQDMTVFLGPRWVLLDEELHLNSVFLLGPNHTTDNTLVENKMLGGQIGVRGKVFKMDPLCMDAFVKGGYFNNEISVRQRLNQQLGGSFTAGREAENETFIVEAGLGANVKIMEHLALSLGYQALWIEEAANAPDEYVSSIVIVGSRVNVNTEDVIYHGGRASLVVSW